MGTQPAIEANDVWIVDPEYSTARFIIRGPFSLKVEGRFEEMSGTITRNRSDVTKSRVEASIRSASLQTGNSRRDGRLKSVEWLAASSVPEISFKSIEVERRDRDTLLVTGILTLRGVSRKLSLDVIEVDRSTSPRGQELAYYAVRAKLDRFDFGLKRSRWRVGRQVEVAINIQAIKC
ncbi:MAG TPA: YceI family protein [Blastocatellia bacterium]|nr:YceI family protein [Blastocatellia bacterium]